MITVVTLIFRYALPVRDGDLWWHMVYGRYFLENKTLIADHTLFSWTPSSNDTIYCTWLPDIFFYLLHKLAGLPGLFAFRYTCLFLLLLACFFYARKLKLASHPFVWLIILIAILMSYTAAFLKPEIFSFTLMTLTVWCWYEIRAQDKNALGWCYLIPLIMLIWVNSHGGFVFGAAFLFVAAVGELLNTWFSNGNMLSPRCRKHLFLALLLAALTIFLTPYGYHYPLDLIYDLIPTKENMAYNMKISAYFRPFESFTPYHSFELHADGAIVILLTLCTLSFIQKKIEWSNLLTNMLFAFLYTKFLRTTFFWAPVFAISSIYMLHSVTLQLQNQKARHLMKKLFPPIILASVLLISGYTLKNAYCHPEDNLWMGFGISYVNPSEEAEYIKKYFPTSRIGNTYNEGGYLMWKLWPENKVLFDPRHFPYKTWSDDFFDNMNGPDIEGVKDFIQRHPCELWCISLYHLVPLLFFTQSPDWQLAFYGKNSVVFARKDVKLPAGTPKISPDIAQVKNLHNVLVILSFATTIQDWETTDKLLAVIKNNFHCGDYNFLYQWSTILRNGMKAYWAGKYGKAVLEFEKLPTLFITPVPPYLTDSYQRLMAQAWKNNDDKAALILATKVWSITKKNPYAAYNLGVIGWYFSSKKKIPLGNDTVDPSRWRYHLTYFLEQTQGSKSFEDARVVAQQILGGDFPALTKPGIIVPGDVR